MLTPEYLEKCPLRVDDLWAQAEMDILADMARKISEYDYFSAASDWQAQKLKEMGMMRSEIYEQLSKLTGKTKKEIKKLLNDAGMQSLNSDKDVYSRNGVAVGKYRDNPALVQVMDASLEKTNNTFYNLTRTTANAGAQQFVESLDRAYMQVVVGGVSQDAVVRREIGRLATEGLRCITYKGRTDHIDVAVRRAVRTGVAQTAGKLAKKMADETETDLVEVTAHSGARPSHAEWQGKIYSRSGTSKKYPDFKASTGYGTAGGLCGVNCRHNFYPFFEDSEPAYTDAELAALDAKKYEWNGRRLSEYEATQQQRYHERQLRRWKREQAMLKAARENTEKADAKVKRWKAQQADFLEQTGLKRYSELERI